jgi:hypothetical protein
VSPAALFLRIRRNLSGREIGRSIPTRAACGSADDPFPIRDSSASKSGTQSEPVRGKRARTASLRVERDRAVGIKVYDDREAP